MVKNEIVMKIDNIGRLVIPKKYREVLDICGDSSVLLILDDDKIIIKKNKKKYFSTSLVLNFINNWLSNYSSDTIILTDLIGITSVYGKNKKFRLEVLNDKIINIINDSNFEMASFKDEKLFKNENLYFFDIISLESLNSKIGSIIIVHQDKNNLDDKFKSFLFNFFSTLNK